MNGQLLDTRLLLLVHTARLLDWCRWQGPLHGRQARSQGVSGCCMPGLMSAGSSAPLGQQRRWGGGRGRARPYPTGRWLLLSQCRFSARFAPLISCWRPGHPAARLCAPACRPYHPQTHPPNPRRFVIRSGGCGWMSRSLQAQPAPKRPGPGVDSSAAGAGDAFVGGEGGRRQAAEPAARAGRPGVLRLVEGDRGRCAPPHDWGVLVAACVCGTRRWRAAVAAGVVIGSTSCCPIGCLYWYK